MKMISNRSCVYLNGENADGGMHAAGLENYRWWSLRVLPETAVVKGKRAESLASLFNY